MAQENERPRPRPREEMERAEACVAEAIARAFGDGSNALRRVRRNFSELREVLDELDEHPRRDEALGP